MTASQTPGSPWKNHTRAALLPLSTILNHSARVYLNRRLQSLHTQARQTGEATRAHNPLR